MTIYTCDLLSLESLSKMDNAQNIVSICLKVCSDVAIKLAKFPTMSDQTKDYIWHQHNSIRYLMTMLQKNNNNLAVRIVHVEASRCDASINVIETLTEHIYDNMYYVRIIELMSCIIASTITCLTINEPSISIELINECQYRINEAIEKLFIIFPKPVAMRPHNFVHAIATIKVEDNKNGEINLLGYSQQNPFHPHPRV
jgi:hypothetical protein